MVNHSTALILKILNPVITFVDQEKRAGENIKLPKWIYYIIPPVFDALTDDKLLSKCFHGERQNLNESCNNTVSIRFAKTIYVSGSIMEVGAHSGSLHFNKGAYAISNILPYFKIANGCFVGKVRKLASKRIKRLRKMDIKTSESGKRRRQRL